MSMTPELVKSKLATLDITQDSIVSVSGWLLFHRRSAKLIVDVWTQALRDGSANRKLSLVYLANEVAQQSRAKRRTEYPEAFAAIMPDAIENVFRHATTDVQRQVIRVVDVWKARSIFPPEVLTDISNRFSNNKPVAAQTNSTTSMAMPSNLTSAATAYTKLLELASSSSLTLGTANNLYSSLLPESGVPPAMSSDLYKAKLAVLSKSIDAAIVNIQSALSVRTGLIKELQDLIQDTLSAQEAEQLTLLDLRKKKESVLKASSAALPGVPEQRSTTPEMDPPRIEALTPPPEDVPISHESMIQKASDSGDITPTQSNGAIASTMMDTEHADEEYVP